MKNIYGATFFILVLFALSSAAIAASKESTYRIVVIRQVKPEGDLQAVLCKESNSPCSLNLDAFQGVKNLKADVLLYNGQACFKFKMSGEYLNGGNERFFCMPIGKTSTIEDVILYKRSPHEKEDNRGILKRPVIRHPGEPVVSLQIKIFPWQSIAP
ncbi:MAG: hypothetical protein ACAH83_16670 [Alphaproteobacteria bacterium]